MSIAGIGAVAAVPLTPPAPTPVLDVSGANLSPGITTGAGVTPVAGGNGDFGNVLTQAVQGIADRQGNVDALAQQAATGSLTDVHQYLIASTEASLATQLTVTVRNKALEAFNEIMRMPL